MDDTFTNVETRIVTRIKELGLKQLDICQETGLSTTAMSAYCTGKRIPETSALHRISKALKISMEWILTGEDITSEELANNLDRTEVLKEKQNLICDGSPLKDEEADLVAMYRLLPSHEREDLFDLAYFKYKKHVEKKRESIYSLYTRGSSNAAGGLVEDDDNEGGIA